MLIFTNFHVGIKIGIEEKIHSQAFEVEEQLPITTLAASWKKNGVSIKMAPINPHNIDETDINSHMVSITIDR